MFNLKKFKFLTKNKIAQLPQGPGVYAFKAKKELFYIGKAGNIKERIKNHFQRSAYRNNFFLDKVKKIGYIKTDSEIEALILEAELIKKYQPKYNVMWRDDKNYFYIGITKENFPRVFITHQPRIINNKKQITNNKQLVVDSKQLVEYLGPFVDGLALKQTLKVLRKVFPYRSCKLLPKRPCLWHQLGRCLAPCLLKPNKIFAVQSMKFSAQLKKSIEKECQKNVKNLIKILQGKKRWVLKDLKKEMKKASRQQNFERAGKIRNQISSLEKILSHGKIFNLLFSNSIKKEDNYQKWKKIEKLLQKLFKIKIKISRIEAYDISNLQGKEATGAMVTFVKGLPDKNYYRRFRIKIKDSPNDIAMIKEILLRRFSHPEWPFPDLILIDGGKAQLNASIFSKSQIKNAKNIKIVSLAKKTNKLYLENQKKPLLLESLPKEIINLILQLRDEAHRFAISYHRKLRRKKLIPF